MLSSSYKNRNEIWHVIVIVRVIVKAMDTLVAVRI